MNSNVLDRPRTDPNPRSSLAIEGVWSGAVEVAGTPLAIRLRIASSEPGLSVVADFPQQQRNGFVFGEASFDGRTLRFTSRSLGRFGGRLGAGGQSIEGEFVEDGRRYRMQLQRGDHALPEPQRPQTPQAPFGYAIESVEIGHPSGHFRLAGTLTTPPRDTLRSAIVLINGSGALDRDETLFGHKPFWVLADYLSRRGHAVLRLDDRGVGESGGDRAHLVLEDEIADMAVAIDWLHRREELRGLPLGLIGHSMGGGIALRLAADRGDLAFAISLAGIGLPLSEVLALRECDTLQRSGADPQAIARHGAFARALFDDLSQRAFDSAIDAAHVAALAQSHGASATAQAHGTDWIARYNQRWFRSALRFDPLSALSRLRIPLLALNGDRDVQTPAKPNLDAIAAALAATGHMDVTTVELPKLNHLFQTCTTGEAYEYAVIEETFAPMALHAIADWLEPRFGPLAARTR